VRIEEEIMIDAHGQVEAGKQLVRTAEAAGIRARLLGGVAIGIHSPSTALPCFQRPYEDIDIAIEKSARRKIDVVVANCGYQPDVEFNNFNGSERRVYYSETHGKLDVFVGQFSMCHVLSLEGRFELDTPTLPLADLLLTKAQIYELNRKDAYDLLALMLDHEIGLGDDDVIDAERIRQVCGADWGFWRTVRNSLELLEVHVGRDADLADYRQHLSEAIAQLREHLDSAPKSPKWKLRSKIGDRKVWYVLPEDPERCIA
jgi:hypothetical protein